MAELTVTDLAKELKVSTSKLLRLTRAGQLPHLRIGRAIRYELDAVKAALRVAVQTDGSARLGTTRRSSALTTAPSPVSAERMAQWRADIRAAKTQRRA